MCDLTFYFSFYLYDVSHPDKNSVPTIDLSKDHEADIDVTGLTEMQEQSKE